MIELDHMRKVDFLTKGLPVKIRRRFIKLMDDINPVSIEYHEFLDMQPIENLINEFGCKYADYVPKSYRLLKCPLDDYLEGLPGEAIKEFFK